MIAKQIADKVVFKILQEQFDDWKWDNYKEAGEETIALGFEDNEDRHVVWAHWTYEEDCVVIEVRKNDEVETNAIYTLDQIMEVM